MLNNDPEAALRLARSNWEVQREPADLRILAEAAHATRDGRGAKDGPPMACRDQARIPGRDQAGKRWGGLVVTIAGRTLTLFAALFLILIEGVALAHKPSDSYLKLDIEGATIAGQWDIALRDLDYAIGLDSNQDNAITWGEVIAKHDGNRRLCAGAA